ncbi:MAG TPA: hypothetical protein VMQ86_04270 [Bryobacteraceae bacterium]|nr:hypothetical protein [Bryobacteraceae bacterium]
MRLGLFQFGVRGLQFLVRPKQFFGKGGARFRGLKFRARAHFLDLLLLSLRSKAPVLLLKGTAAQKSLNPGPQYGCIGRFSDNIVGAGGKATGKFIR